MRYQEQYEEFIPTTPTDTTPTDTTPTDTTPTDTTPTGGNPWDNDSAFFEWFMGSNPNMDWDSLSEQQQNAYWTSYQQVTEETGGDDTTPTDTSPPDTTTGGDAGFFTWLAEQGVTREQFDNLPVGAQMRWQEQYEASLAGAEEEVDPNDPTKVGDKWIESAGNLWASYEEAYASNVRIRQAEEERSGRVKDFEDRFAEYQKLIDEGSAEEVALASRLEARARAQLERRIEDSILATRGEVPEGFEERLAETSTRQLLDIHSNIEQRRIAQLTAAKQFEIGTDMSLEQIGMQETGLEQQMFQFLSTQAQREAQFEGTMGMQQAELALRKQLGLGQLDLGRDQLAWQRKYGGEELDIMKADVEGQPQWWERIITTGAQVGGTVLSYKLMSGTCFDVTTPVISQNGFIPIGMLKQGDMISTTNGYRPVKRVHQYNNHSTLNIDGMKVTEHHPYIIENGDVVLSGDLKVGNKLWGGKAIKSIEQEKGSGRVFNIDIDGNTFHLGNATLVHTGRNKNGV